MQTITKTFKVYTLGELSNEAKENARRNYANDDIEHFHIEDGLNTINEALDHFGYKLVGYHISPYSWSSDVVIKHVSAEALTMEELQDSKLSESCPFTGHMYDEDFLDGIREFLKLGSLDLDGDELIHACTMRVVKAINRDTEYSATLEALEDHAECNGLLFLESGEIYAD